jgi:hypothetical protein
MALAVVGHGSSAALFHRQTGLRSVERQWQQWVEAVIGLDKWYETFNYWLDTIRTTDRYKLRPVMDIVWRRFKFFALPPPQDSRT